MADKKLVITYRKAFENKPELDAYVTHIADSTGAKPISNLKNPKTAIEKVKTKQQEDPQRGYKLEDVNDIARSRLVYGSLREVRSGIKAFKKDIGQTDMKITKTDDFFDHPEDGYEGYHVDVSFPNGQHSEVQFHTINSYAAALATHNLHAEADHEEMTPEERQKNVDVNEVVRKLNPNSAATVAQLIEAKNQPAQQKAQVAAIQTAGGQT